MRRLLLLIVLLVPPAGCGRHFVVKPEEVAGRDDRQWTVISAPAAPSPAEPAPDPAAEAPSPPVAPVSP
jgi:hypothetical protein